MLIPFLLGDGVTEKKSLFKLSHAGLTKFGLTVMLVSFASRVVLSPYLVQPI